MPAPTSYLPACITLTLLIAPTLAPAQDAGRVSQVQVAAGAGFLTSGAYFAGPGGLEVTNGDAFVAALQAGIRVNRTLAVVIAAAHARPEAELTGVPLIGSLAVPGVRLWFTDAALRAQTPLSRAPRAPRLFAQAGAGIVHYAITTTLLGTAVDEQATNFALVLGAGLELPITTRLGIETLVKDHIASFKSVRDLEEFGVEGRRAHTLVLLLSARVGL